MIIDLYVKERANIASEDAVRKMRITTDLRCILDLERSRNQRQGSEFFLGKWIL